MKDVIDQVDAWVARGDRVALAYLAVLTHDPKIDDQVLVLALRSEPAYIGAMGSKRAQAARHGRAGGRLSDRGDGRIH